MKFNFILTLFSLFFTTTVLSNIKSTSGSIPFDVQSDGNAEMTLSNDGLNIQGGLSLQPQFVNSDTTLSNNTTILVDTSSDNIRLTLPTANTCIGLQYHIKKTSANNQLLIVSNDTIDGHQGFLELSYEGTFLPSCSLISNGTGWLVLQKSKKVVNVIASDNLVGWWKLDELSGTTALDSSGNDREGTLTGFTFSANGLISPINRGLYFDGSDDLIQVDEDDALDPAKITLMAWVNITETANSRNFFNKGHNSGYRFRVTAGEQLQFLDRGATNTLVSSSTLPLETWIHAAVTGDSGGLKIYINGILDNSNATAYGAPNTSDQLDLGKYNPSSERYQGGLDDARIYNRTLTQAEIQAIYQQGL